MCNMSRQVGRQWQQEKGAVSMLAGLFVYTDEKEGTGGNTASRSLPVVC